MLTINHVALDQHECLYLFLSRYCYNDDINVELKLALGTLYAAKKYLLPILEKACRDIQVSNLSGENIWETYVASFTYPDEELHEACKAHFKDSISKVEDAFKSPDFLTIPAAILHDVLQMNTVKDDDGKTMLGIFIADIELFKACNAWAEAECLRQGKEPSGDNKRKVLGDDLFHICFPDMLPVDIANFVLPTGILTLEEQVELFKDVNGTEKIHKNFPSRDYTIALMPIDHSGHRSREESRMNFHYASFNIIKVKPKYRILLSGIWLTGTSPMGEYEVVIEQRPLVRDSNCSVNELTKRKWPTILCKVLLSEAIKGRKGPIQGLPLDKPFLLEAGFNYSIKVAHLEEVGSEAKPKSQLYDRKTFEQLSLKVNEASNELITALLLQLV